MIWSINSCAHVRQELSESFAKLTLMIAYKGHATTTEHVSIVLVVSNADVRQDLLAHDAKVTLTNVCRIHAPILEHWIVFSWSIITIVTANPGIWDVIARLRWIIVRQALVRTEAFVVRNKKDIIVCVKMGFTGKIASLVDMIAIPSHVLRERVKLPMKEDITAFVQSVLAA